MAEAFKNILDLGGLRTDSPEDKIPDRNATEVRNIDFSLKGMIQTKEGYGLIGNEIAGGGQVTRLFVFKKAFGTQEKILVRVRDTGSAGIMEWLNPNNTDYEGGKWEPLVTALTTNKVMSFAVANGNNGELINVMVFCDGVCNLSYWNGAVGTVASVTSNTIVLDEVAATEGFTTTGSVLIDGTEYAYTGVSSKTLTGVTPDPTTQNPDAGTGVAQKPDTTTHAALDKGNILLVTQGKLFISGLPNGGSEIVYSTTGNIFDFSSTPSGLADFGSTRILDGGGKNNAMVPYGNNAIIVHKENAVIKYGRSINSDGTVLESFDVLSDSEDAGATNVKATTSINREQYYVTNFEGLKQLSKVVNGDDIQLNSITSVILPTLENWDMEDAAAVYYPAKRCIKFGALNNDNDRKTVTYYLGTQDFSIDDEPALDFAFINRGLYFGTPYDQNVYKCGIQKSANGSPINHSYVTKSFNFGEPAKDKDFNILYLEGLISSYCKIKITVYYGQYGIDGESSYTLAWNDSKNVAAQKISALGTEVLGTVSLGASSENIRDSYPFSLPIHFNATRAGQYKIKIETLYDDETQQDYEVYWAVTNISTNPKLGALNQNKIRNSNILGSTGTKSALSALSGISPLGALGDDWVRIGADTDGSWRLTIDNSNLVIQRKESGTWGTKQTYTP